MKKAKIPGQTTAGTPEEIKAAIDRLNRAKRVLEKAQRERPKEFSKLDCMTEAEIREEYAEYGCSSRNEAKKIINTLIERLAFEYGEAKYNLEYLKEARYPLLRQS